MKKTISIIIIILVSFAAIAQKETLSTKSKKAIKYFNLAVGYYNARDDKAALENLDNAIKCDSNFIEAHILKANVHHDNWNYVEEIYAYKKAIKINPEFSAKSFYFLGQAQMKIGQYQDAKASFEKALTIKNDLAKINNSLNENIKKADFCINLVTHPVPFDPKNMGDNINTKYDEYWPSLTTDEQMLYITAQIPSNPDQIVTSNGMQEDFFVSEKVNGQWQKTYNVGAPINTPNNEGALCVSPDGQYFFYTVCNRPEDFGSCDIYFSKKTGNTWSTPKNIGKAVNSPFWESNPSFSSDGKTLYYTSNRKGSKGKMDIWSTQITGVDANGNLICSSPVNLGDSINTIENEMAPFIHPDNQTLYFSSDGHWGLGDYDIFYSRKQGDSWTKATNISFPINSYKDERGIIVNSKGELAYFASAREAGKGLDIYQFDMYSNARPTKVIYVKGKIFDSETKQKLAATFELIDIETQKIIVTSTSDAQSGEYLVCLPVDKNYAFNASKKGYMFYSENFSLKDIGNSDEPYKLDIPLQPIKEENKIVLKNIFFETDSYVLKPQSKAELEKLIQFMSQNATVSIEVSGHTDNVGTKEYNQKLSENRAKAVYDYLVNTGVAKERMTYKGYNFSSPIATNDTEAGKALNRRTEFKIVSVKK